MLVVLAPALVLVSMSFGAAASLGGLSSTAVGADGTSVTPCDSDGFAVSYETSGGSVTSATVSGIADPGCEGAQLSLTLTQNDASLGSGGPIAVPTDGDTSANSVTVSLTPQPTASSVDRVHVSVVGP